MTDISPSECVESSRNAAGPLEIACGCCSGIEWGGDSPRECRTCAGTGGLILYQSDRVALYRGGPFAGYWPGEYAREVARRSTETPRSKS